MLHLAYLGESKHISFSQNAVKLFIVRKPVSGIPSGFIHVPQLSPSLPLFDKAQKWKQKQYTKEEKDYLDSIERIADNEAWWFLYKKDFERELKERPDMVKAMKRLEERLKRGEEIYAFC